MVRSRGKTKGSKEKILVAIFSNHNSQTQILSLEMAIDTVGFCSVDKHRSNCYTYKLTTISYIGVKN